MSCNSYSVRSVICVFWVAIAMVTAISCQHQEHDPLEEALKFAGDNRAELEKVLDHYKDDSLKLAAAKYLISGMPGYYWYDTPMHDTIEAMLLPLQDKVMNFKLEDDDRIKVSNYNFENDPKVYDAQAIKADYLIKNIDMAFEQWRGRPWNAHLDFDQFCELLLPYRVGNERLTDWRQAYIDSFGIVLDSIYTGDDPVEAATAVLRYMADTNKYYYNDEVHGPHRDAMALLKCRIGNSRDIAERNLYVMRALGIPVAIDLVLDGKDPTQPWPLAQWAVMYDYQTNNFLNFDYNQYPSRSNNHENCPAMGLVHRRKFNGRTCVNVSSEYYGSSKIYADVDGHPDEVYLGVFHGGKWRPIGLGKRDGSKYCFENTQEGVFYAPLRYVNDQVVPCGNPFVNLFGDTRVLDASDEMEYVKLTRLLPLSARVAKWRGADLEYTSVIAYEDASFTHGDTLLTIPKGGVKYGYNRFVVNEPGKEYQYLRVTFDGDRFVQLGELMVYSDAQATIPIELEVISEFSEQLEVEHLIDWNIKEGFTSTEDIHSVDLKLNKPKNIASVVVVPRNDVADVWPNRKYELLYLDDKHTWHSLGIKEARSETVEFKAPKNALLWLRDVEDRTTSRAFVYSNNTQRWRL